MLESTDTTKADTRPVFAGACWSLRTHAAYAGACWATIRLTVKGTKFCEQKLP